MANPTKLYDEAFLTGCDEGHEWILPWFIKNYKKHCKKPLIFADFGLSDLGRAVVRENVHAVMDLTKVEERGWFKNHCQCTSVQPRKQFGLILIVK